MNVIISNPWHGRVFFNMHRVLFINILLLICLIATIFWDTVFRCKYVSTFCIISVVRPAYLTVMHWKSNILNIFNKATWLLWGIFWYIIQRILTIQIYSSSSPPLFPPINLLHSVLTNSDYLGYFPRDIYNQVIILSIWIILELFV